MKEKKAGMTAAAAVMVAVLAIVGGMSRETKEADKTAAMPTKARISATQAAPTEMPTETPKATEKAATKKPTATPAKAKKAASATKKPQTEEKVYIASKSSKVYHSKKTCSGMKNPKEITLKEAEKKGKRPCKKCYKK